MHEQRHLLAFSLSVSHTHLHTDTRVCHFIYSYSGWLWVILTVDDKKGQERTVLLSNPWLFPLNQIRYTSNPSNLISHSSVLFSAVTSKSFLSSVLSLVIHFEKLLFHLLKTEFLTHWICDLCQFSFTAENLSLCHSLWLSPPVQMCTCMHTHTHTSAWTVCL